MQWQAWPASAAGGNFIRKTDRPDAIENRFPARSRARLSSTGEPIREAKLVNAKGSGFMAAILPSGMRAVSTQISPETGAGGFILPNDHVDVILTRRDREAEKATGAEVHVSETILNNIRVLAIDQTVEEKNGQKVVVGKTATLELTPRQAETLALAQQLGTLSLALRSITDAECNKHRSADDSAIADTAAASTSFASASAHATTTRSDRGDRGHGDKDIDPHRGAGGADRRGFGCAGRFRRAGADARSPVIQVAASEATSRFVPLGIGKSVVIDLPRRHQGRARRRSENRQCGDPLLAARLHDRRHGRPDQYLLLRRTRAGRSPASTSR